MTVTGRQAVAAAAAGAARLGLLAAVLMVAGLLVAALPARAADAPVGLSGKPIIFPTAVVIYRHAALTDAAFVAAVVERLQAFLKPPVELRDASFAYADAPRNVAGQVDGLPLVQRFYQAHGGDGPAGAFKVLLIPDDIVSEPYRFLFAFNYGSEATDARLSVVSLARLADKTLGLPKSTRTVRTADRVFKLIAKNAAKTGGFTGSGGCLLGFSRSVGELDLIPPMFCEEDARQLQAAGLLRP